VSPHEIDYRLPVSNPSITYRFQTSARTLRRDALRMAIQEAILFLEVGLRDVTFAEQVEALRVLSGVIDDALDVLDPVDA
jgi:hypothetical protein